MKKVLFFAFAALTICFVACDQKDQQKDEPTPQDEINIKDYVGSMWYLDSINMGGFTTTHMCQPVFLLSEDTMRLGNDVEPFKYENKRLFIRENIYNIVSMDKNGIVLSQNERTIYVAALPALDRNKQIAISESALIGRYKQVISLMEETGVDGTKTISYSTGGLILWINLKADHKMVYEDSNPNIEDTEGCWAVKPAEQLISWGGVRSYDDLIAMNHWENILVFNEDYLVTGEDYDYDETMGFTHRHYESVLLRVE